jgi:hypothetical protein
MAASRRWLIRQCRLGGLITTSRCGRLVSHHVEQMLEWAAGQRFVDEYQPRLPTSASTLPAMCFRCAHLDFRCHFKLSSFQVADVFIREKISK